jgi:hypothetical protein
MFFLAVQVIIIPITPWNSRNSSRLKLKNASWGNYRVRVIVRVIVGVLCVNESAGCICAL